MRMSNIPTEQIREVIQATLDRPESPAAFAIGLLEELIDRREAEASELRQLERGLAYDHACSVIEGCCAPVGDFPSEWYDVDDVAELSDFDVKEVVLYLEARGLIERDPTHPNHVAIRDESEATA